MNRPTRTLAELAAIMGKTPNTVRRDMCRHPERLPPWFKAPGSKTPLWLSETVDKFLQLHAADAKASPEFVTKKEDAAKVIVLDATPSVLHFMGRQSNGPLRSIMKCRPGAFAMTRKLKSSKPPAPKVGASQVPAHPRPDDPQHAEWLIDEGEDESFPASDPQSITQPHRKPRTK